MVSAHWFPVYGLGPFWGFGFYLFFIEICWKEKEESKRGVVMSKITIEVDVKEFIEKEIRFIRTDTKSIKKHLETLNGAVAQNTKFRHWAKGGLGALFITITIIAKIIWEKIKSFPGG